MTANTETDAVRPITRRQRIAVMAHFRRLGLAHPTWRPYRLDIASALGCRRRITSVNDLTFGEAGRLLGTLNRCRDTRSLAALIAAETVELYDTYPEVFTGTAETEDSE